MILTYEFQLFMGPGKALVGLLGVPTKSLGAYVIKIVVAFLLSGVVHAATLPHDLPGVSPLRYASFFWVQGVCVLVEVLLEQALMLHFQGSARVRPVWRRLCSGFARLVWTVAALYLTLPLIVDELTRVTRTFGLRPVFLFP
jgi:hypothetical protein